MISYIYFREKAIIILFLFPCLSEITGMQTYFYINATGSVILYQCMKIMIWHQVVSYKRYLLFFRGQGCHDASTPHCSQVKYEFSRCIMFDGTGTVFLPLFFFCSHFSHIIICDPSVTHCLDLRFPLPRFVVAAKFSK